jgi:hypothetical protein
MKGKVFRRAAVLLVAVLGVVAATASPAGAAKGGRSFKATVDV